jgi:hypothetical protein
MKYFYGLWSEMQQQSTDNSEEALVEGRDYYLEHGKYVFTEAYHKMRGICCGSRCRHCPFNHENVPK